MGSWSESCGFSGIEISEGEYAYVAFVGTPKYPESFTPEALYQLKTPLLRGSYNDYGYLRVEDNEGVIALFNHLSGLNLKNGDDFSSVDEHWVEGLSRYWIREDIFKGLSELKQDFPYYGQSIDGEYKSVPVKNIGESLKLHREQLSKALHEFADKMQKVQAMANKLEGMPRSERFELIEILSDRPLRDLFGPARYGIDWTSIVKSMPDGVTSEGFDTAYSRAWVLLYAAGELRKKIVPSEQIGPQWGGAEASIKFAKQILEIQKERRKS